MDPDQFVVDFMTPNPVVVGPELVVADAMKLAEANDVHDLLVVDAYRLVGVTCRCDLSSADAASKVCDCMRAPVTVDDQATVGSALEVMEHRHVGCLPVVDWTGNLKGILTRHDLRHAGYCDGDRTCASCGSTHGLVSEEDEGATFCLSCMQQGRRSSSGHRDYYFTLGGGD